MFRFTVKILSFSCLVLMTACLLSFTTIDVSAQQNRFRPTFPNRQPPALPPLGNLVGTNQGGNFGGGNNFGGNSGGGNFGGGTNFSGNFGGGRHQF